MEKEETVFQVMCQLILYKTIILPVLLYGVEAGTLLSTDATALTAFETKVLRKIFDSEWTGNDFRIRSNSEVYEFLNDVGIQRLLWLDHVVRIEENAQRDGYLMGKFAEVG